MKPTKAETELAKEIDAIIDQWWKLPGDAYCAGYLAKWILERFERKPVHVTKTQLAKTRKSFMKTLDETAKAKKAKRKACR